MELFYHNNFIIFIYLKEQSFSSDVGLPKKAYVPYLDTLC